MVLTAPRPGRNVVSPASRYSAAKVTIVSLPATWEYELDSRGVRGNAIGPSMALAEVSQRT